MAASDVPCTYLSRDLDEITSTVYSSNGVKGPCQSLLSELFCASRGAYMRLYSCTCTTHEADRITSNETKSELHNAGDYATDGILRMYRVIRKATHERDYVESIIARLNISGLLVYCQ